MIEGGTVVDVAAHLIAFEVRGEPKSKGSKRGFVVKRKGGAQGVAMVESAGPALREWSGRVSAVVQAIAAEHTLVRPFAGPVEVEIRFHMPRRSGTRKAETWHTKRPDADKLARTVLDCLSGVLYGDDAQVVSLHVSKLYAPVDEGPGAEVVVREVEAL